MIQIGTVTLGEAPRVVVALGEGVPRADVDAALAAGAHLVELRIDQFSSRDPEAVLRETARFRDLPLLATIRAAHEGGAWRRTDAERLALYRALLPQVDAVDVELSSRDIAAPLVEAAQATGKVTLGSYHNFQATPSWEALAAIAGEGKALGVDILKVACCCNTAEDLRVLARFTLEYRTRNVVSIGMGPAGMLSRVFFPALGSLLTYTFLGAPTAPGQLNCEDTMKYLLAFYPGLGNEA
jgi:3-dehydroquinate dehydratase-1